jgi:hypothetical protein
MHRIKNFWGDLKCSEGFIRYEDGVRRKIADKKRSGSVMFIDSVTNGGGKSRCNSE